MKKTMPDVVGWAPRLARWAGKTPGTPGTP